MQSVTRALNILETVAASGELGVTEIAVAVGLHVATTHNLLRTLSNHGYLKNRSGRYRMGVSAALLAGQGDVAEGLSEFLEPWMKRLSRETGEAASAFVLGDGLARIITFQPGTYALTIHFPKRIWHDVLSLATGRLLVAELPEYEWPQFISDENRTGKSKWTSLLREIHRVGYCICWHPEQLAMAFPVRNRFGRIMFAVGASAPVSRATPDQCALMFTSIRKIACDLSQGFECPNKLLKTLAITALPDGEIESFQNPNIG